jgi:hypothetical protein
MSHTRYTVFDNNIISDVFGEEVVLVNLESGVYYSLRGSATQIWIRLVSQYAIPEIITDLLNIYQVAEQDLVVDIDQFINQLIDFKIIKITSDSTSKPIEFTVNTTLLEYNAPILETFSDMQEILLLDPVHDVDKAGWPISKNLDTQS